MSRSKPLTVGAMSFPTQKAAEDFIRQQLYNQPLSAVIPEPLHSFLVALVSRHPRSAEKIGPGVKHFTVEPASYGTRCFYLTRVDGTQTDFSFLKCVRGAE
jgi:hypothetical protein